MRKIPAMVDMRNTPDELKDLRDPVPQAPTYPYGLCIRLQKPELDKLGLSGEGVAIGDMLHMHCLARVTSISTHDNASGESNCCVELQITDMVGEDEDEENQENEPTPAATRRTRLYG